MLELRTVSPLVLLAVVGLLADRVEAQTTPPSTVVVVPVPYGANPGPAPPPNGYVPPPPPSGYVPAPGQPQQGYPPAYPQQGYPPAYPQQGYPPAYPQQGYPPSQGYAPAPGYPPQGYAPAPQPYYAPQYPGQPYYGPRPPGYAPYFGSMPDAQRGLRRERAGLVMATLGGLSVGIGAALHAGCDWDCSGGVYELRVGLLGAGATAGYVGSVMAGAGALRASNQLRNLGYARHRRGLAIASLVLSLGGYTTPLGYLLGWIHYSRVRRVAQGDVYATDRGPTVAWGIAPMVDPLLDRYGMVAGGRF